MNKFRSFNYNTRNFAYFENGKYYYFDDNDKKDISPRPYFVESFWVNAEQCYVENLNIQEIIYKNDIGIIEYLIEPYHDEKGYHYVKRIKGVVGFDLYEGLYVINNDVKYYVNNYKDSFFIIIGNIHENKED